MTAYRPTSLVSVAARPDLFGQAAWTAREFKSPATEAAPFPPAARILFIGDPYLDADTPLLLLEQAWHDAGVSPAPRLINGYVPDTIEQYTKRIEHHVLRHRPTHVVMTFGPQYALLTQQRIAPAQFAEELTALIDRLAREGIESILATGYRFRSTQAEAQHVLDDYNEQIRAVAQQRGLRLVDVDRRFRDANPLDSIVDARGQATSFAASQLIVAALLEGLGQRETPVPTRLQMRLLPGVVTDWQFHGLPRDHRPLSAEEAKNVTPDATWLQLHLPQDDRFTPRLAEPSHSSLYRERSAGFATNLSTSDLPRVQASAAVRCDVGRTAYLHVGGGAIFVWVNGEKVFDDKAECPGGRGHYAGFETRIIQLTQGENRLLVECNGSFFVSITDTRDPPRRAF